MAISLNYLANLYTDGSGGTGSLLATMYGFAGKTTSTSGLNPAVALAAAEKNETRRIDETARQPMVKRDIDAFTAGVAKATSVKALLANPAVMKVLLTANGLGDQIAYTALAERTLQSNPQDPKALANTLSDTRWKSAVKTYDFANKGLSVIRQPQVIATIADGYAEVLWRKSLDAETPGLSNALTFRKQAKTIGSVLQILGDSVLRKVVTTALGVPEQIAFQPLDTQVRAISSRVDIAKFKDEKFVEKFIHRYLLAAASNASSSSTTATIETLAKKAAGLIV